MFKYEHTNHVDLFIGTYVKLKFSGRGLWTVSKYPSEAMLGLRSCVQILLHAGPLFCPVPLSWKLQRSPLSVWKLMPGKMPDAIRPGRSHMSRLKHRMFHARSQRCPCRSDSIIKSSPTKYSIMFEHNPSLSSSSFSPPKILFCSTSSFSRSSLCFASRASHAMYRLCQCRAERSFHFGFPRERPVAVLCWQSEGRATDPRSGSSKVGN